MRPKPMPPCTLIATPYCAPSHLARRIALLAGGDAVVLIAFAAIGRMNHGEPLDGTLGTALPFLIGECCDYVLEGTDLCQLFGPFVLQQLRGQRVTQAVAVSPYAFPATLHAAWAVITDSSGRGTFKEHMRACGRALTHICMHTHSQQNSFWHWCCVNTFSCLC